MVERGTEFAYDVFISYSHADKEWVWEWLVPRLKEAGLAVCTDRESFDVGVPALVNMENAVAASRHTLLVLTPAWVKSEWTNFEALLVQTDDPIGLRRRMLPLMLEKCRPPKRVSIFTYADFTQPDQWEIQFERIVDAINDKISLPKAIALPVPTSPSRVPFVLPQLDVSTFTGRDVELTQLEELIVKREGPKVCSIIGLAGTAGIGKSALACHFAELHKADFPDGVIGLRVDGKDIDTIAREFARCCGEEIDPEDQRDATTIMQDVFRHRHALLIFDNADDANIRSLRPGGERCAVIVTTRDRGLPVLLDVPSEGRIDLPPLPDPDSLRLLKRLLGEERVAAEREAACRTIELVGNLPLALQIVGATLQMQERRSLADYAASLREEKSRLAKLKIRGDLYLDVRASFSLSLGLLESEEVDFFACQSVCAEDGFSVQAAMAAGDCDESTAYERLGYLYRLSLLNRPQFGAGRFVFHSLIRLFAQELAVERSLQDDAAERHALFFVELVKTSDVSDRIAASVLAEEMDDIVLAAEWLRCQEIADQEFLIRLQLLFEKHGYWQRAVGLMSEFLRLTERVEDWRAVVHLYIQRAKYLSLRGQWSQARETLTPIAGVIDRIGDEAVRQRCEAMWLTTLGGLLQRLGHFNEAVNAFQRGYDLSVDLEDQHGQAKVLNSLGGVLQDQGSFDKAADAFQRSYDLSVDLGDQHGQAMVLNSLGGVLQRQGRFDEALDTLQRSATIEEQIGDRRGLAMVLTSLGGVLQRLGCFDEAEVAFRRSVEIEGQLGNQRGLAMVLNSLGGVLQRLGRFDEAESAFRRSAEIEELLGNQRGLAMVLNSLGGVLQRQGRFDEAVDAFQRSVAIEEQLGNQRGLAMVLNSLGGVLQRQGRFDEAVDAFQRSYAISEELGDQRGQAMVLNSLGGVFQRQGRFEEAVDAFQRSYAISEELGDQRSLGMVLNSLGGVLQRLGRFGEAEDSFQRSYAISEELGDQRSLGMVLNSLGGVLQRLGRFGEAEDAFRRSYAISEELGDQQSLAMVLNSLGGVLQRLGRFGEAEDAFRRSLAISEELGDQQSLAMVLNSLGGVLQRQGRFDEAMGAFQRSVQIGEKLGDKRHLAMVHTAMGNALLSHGDIEEAAVELRKGFEIDEGLKNRRGMGIVTPKLTESLVRLGRREEALAYCQRALAIVPKNKRLLALHDRLSSEAVLKRGSVKCVIRHPRGYLYGFIAPDDGSPDIFFREGYVDPDTLSRLAEGVRVEVEVEQASRGPRAKNVKVIA